MNKEIKIVLSEDANKQYDDLVDVVGEELKKGAEGSFHQSLLRAIDRIKELLRKNPFLGTQIHKKAIPKIYVQKYGIENLWRIELPKRWRLLYSIEGSEIEIINFIIDFFDHKFYDKIFKYK